MRPHNPVFSQAGNFLDFGCGSGRYLQLMARRGWNVHGVEPSQAGALAARTAGFDVFHSTLRESDFPSGPFDYVRSNHSFEHIPNSIEVLRDIHRILRPGGKLFIGIPNIDSLSFCIFGRYWWHLCLSLHTYHYSSKSLEPLVAP